MFLHSKGNKLKAILTIQLSIYHLIKSTEFQFLTPKHQNLQSV